MNALTRRSVSIVTVAVVMILTHPETMGTVVLGVYVKRHECTKQITAYQSLIKTMERINTTFSS
jgi:hypothetical protein